MFPFFFVLCTSLLNGISISELLELQKLRKTGAGIDITRLNKGLVRRKAMKVAEEDKAEYGLRPGAGPPPPPPPPAEESVHVCYTPRPNSLYPF